MLRVGFLGCGEVAVRRARSMRALNERGESIFECVAACDLAPAKSADFVGRFGGNAYSSVGRMMGEAELDALLVCTPPSARGAGENLALGAGVALWIEPPIAATIRAGNALALAVKKSGVPVMVCAPHRYNPDIERLKKILAAKGAARIERWSGDLGAGLSRTAWRVEVKNGGIWLDGAWPILDILRFLGGEVGKTSARANLENGVAALELESGALASLGISRFGAPREILSGVGEDVRVLVENWTSSVRVELEFEHETTVCSGEDGITRQMEAFARLLKSGKRTENRSAFGDALATLKLGLELGKNKA